MRQRLLSGTTAVAGAIAVVALAAACGTGGSRQAGDASSSASSASPSPTATTSGAASGAEESSTSPAASKSRGQHGRIATKCDADHVRAKVEPRDSAAGNRYAWLVLTNTSATTCTVYGYGGMQLYDGDGHEVPTRLVRDRSVAPTTLSVRPGTSVRSLLHWSVVPHGGDRSENTCQPEASVARVTPPDETHTVGTRWPLGPVCDAGRILQQPYEGTELKAGE